MKKLRKANARKGQHHGHHGGRVERVVSTSHLMTVWDRARVGSLRVHSEGIPLMAPENPPHVEEPQGSRIDGFDQKR